MRARLQEKPPTKRRERLNPAIQKIPDEMICLDRTEINTPPKASLRPPEKTATFFEVFP